MACARLSRREQARLCRVAQAAKRGGDVGVSQREMPLHVLAEDPLRLRLGDDAGDLGPEVSGIGGAAAAPGDAERLAGIAGRDEMNAAAPRAAVEAAQVVPDRRLVQGLVRHPRHESRRCMGFPLDESHSAISGLGDGEAEIEPAIAGAERDAAEVAVLRDEAGR